MSAGVKVKRRRPVLPEGPIFAEQKISSFFRQFLYIGFEVQEHGWKVKKILIIVILWICTVPEARADWVWGEEREKRTTFGFEIGAGMHAAAHEMITATASESGKAGYIYGLGG